TGKIANLAVVKGDLFGRDRFAAHVFVDGKHFEIKEPVRPAGGGGRPGTGTSAGANPAGVVSLSGVYSITIDVPGQPLPATLNFTHQGTALTGSMVSALGTSTISNGRVSGTGFNFTTNVSFQGVQMDITVMGTISGNQISGTVDSPQGSVPFSGTKNP
ncbi:MAG: hypothetical protein AB7J13_11665, partial [Pyrinomonadaceae bacterium]